MRTMKTNELKKGTQVQLRNGWKATIEDNARGNTRMCTVYGFETEMGSVYSHDIMSALVPSEFGPACLEAVVIEHTPAQLKVKAFAASFGM